MAAAALPALLGSAALGVEVSSWLLTQRSMQSAADSAVLAASMNGSTSYVAEARAVAAQYGFTHGSNNVTVAVSNTAPCTSGAASCYGVSITGSQPLFLTKAIGYSGNLVVGGEKRQQLSASATAEPTSRYCLVALAGSGAEEGIRVNGGPKADMTGCSVMSNSDARCNGHNLGAEVGNAHGSNDGCGRVQNADRPKVQDSYAHLAKNFRSYTCSSYPQKPSSKRDAALPRGNTWDTDQNLSVDRVICGDLQLNNNVTVNSAGAVLYIVNGQLDLNGFTLKTASGSALTIVFTGTPGSSTTYTHAQTGNGTLEVTAPTSGPWSGVAMYQDPALTRGVDMSAGGNKLTWNINGLVYSPRASLTFSGAVNKSNNENSCFVLVADNIRVNGTASIFARSHCAEAGLDMPMSRGRLVN